MNGDILTDLDYGELLRNAHVVGCTDHGRHRPADRQDRFWGSRGGQREHCRVPREAQPGLPGEHGCLRHVPAQHRGVPRGPGARVRPARAGPVGAQGLPGELRLQRATGSTSAGPTTTTRPTATSRACCRCCSRPAAAGCPGSNGGPSRWSGRPCDLDRPVRRIRIHRLARAGRPRSGPAGVPRDVPRPGPSRPACRRCRLRRRAAARGAPGRRDQLHRAARRQPVRAARGQHAGDGADHRRRRGGSARDARHQGRVGRRVRADGARSLRLRGRAGRTGERLRAHPPGCDPAADHGQGRRAAPRE